MNKNFSFAVKDEGQVEVLDKTEFDQRYIFTGSNNIQGISSSLRITGSVQISSSRGNVLTVLGDSSRGNSKTLKVIGGSPQIRFGENIEDTGAFLMSFTDNDFIAAGGADFSGTWSAKSNAGAGYIRLVNGTFAVWLSPTTTVSGSDPGFTSSISVSTAGGVVLKGTTTNDSAATGYVGEYIEATGGPITGFTTDVAKAVVSVTLTAGDWDVNGNVTWTSFGTGGNYSAAGLSNGAGIPGAPNIARVVSVQSANFIDMGVTPTRFLLAAGATITLYGQLNFTGGTPTAYGAIRARRMR